MIYLLEMMEEETKVLRPHSPVPRSTFRYPCSPQRSPLHNSVRMGERGREGKRERDRERRGIPRVLDDPVVDVVVEDGRLVAVADDEDAVVQRLPAWQVEHSCELKPKDE